MEPLTYSLSQPHPTFSKHPPITSLEQIMKHQGSLVNRLYSVMQTHYLTMEQPVSLEETPSLDPSPPITCSEMVPLAYLEQEIMVATAKRSRKARRRMRMGWSWQKMTPILVFPQEPTNTMKTMYISKSLRIRLEFLIRILLKISSSQFSRARIPSKGGSLCGFPTKLLHTVDYC